MTKHREEGDRNKKQGIGQACSAFAHSHTHTHSMCRTLWCVRTLVVHLLQFLSLSLSRFIIYLLLSLALCISWTVQGARTKDGERERDRERNTQCEVAFRHCESLYQVDSLVNHLRHRIRNNSSYWAQTIFYLCVCVCVWTLGKFVLRQWTRRVFY